MAKLFCREGPFTFEKTRNLEREVRGHRVRWNSGEMLRYAILVFYFFRKGVLRAQAEQRKWELYRLLSMFVQSKNPNQCRIFHKRVVENYGSL